MLSSFLGCGLLALVQCSSVPAWAQSSNPLANLHLDWPSLAECPAESHLRQMILRTLGSPLPRAYDIWARVTIEKQATWQLRLVIDSADGHGARALEGETCVQVADALAVILAMLIDTEANKAANSTSTGSSRDNGETRYTPYLAPTAVASLPSSVRLLSGSVVPQKPSASWFGFGLGAVVGLGNEHVPRLGVGLTLDYAQGPLRFFAGGNYWPLHRAALWSDQQRGANVSIGSVGISVGPRIVRPPFELVPRVGAAGFLVHAAGYGVDQPLSDTITWWSFGVGNVVLWEVHELFFLQAALDVYVPLARPAARLEPGGDAFRPGPVGAQAYVGAVCRY